MPSSEQVGCWTVRLPVVLYSVPHTAYPAAARLIVEASHRKILDWLSSFMALANPANRRLPHRKNAHLCLLLCVRWVIEQPVSALNPA